MKLDRPPRVLVVDDNLTLRVLMAQLLESHGFVAVAAASAEEALEVARFQPPDVCLVDHLMPGVTGAELIQRLRIQPDPRLRRVPVIGMSAYAGSDRALLEAGALVALRKPCTGAPLIEAITRALESVEG